MVILWMDEVLHHFETIQKKTIVDWFLQANHDFRVSPAVQDFVHPQ